MWAKAPVGPPSRGLSLWPPQLAGLVIPGPRALGSALRAVRAQAPRAELGIHNHRSSSLRRGACTTPAGGYGFRARWQVGKPDLPAPRNDAKGETYDAVQSNGPMPSQLAASPSTVERFGPSRVDFIPTRRLPVPNTLQIPLERNRDVQRRWQQMLQRTAAPRGIPPVGLKYSRTRVRFDVPLNGSSIKPKR